MIAGSTCEGDHVSVEDELLYPLSMRQTLSPHRCNRVMPQLNMINQGRRSGICSAAATSEPLFPLMQVREERLLTGQLEKTEYLMLLESENGAIGIFSTVV